MDGRSDPRLCLARGAEPTNLWSCRRTFVCAPLGCAQARRQILPSMASGVYFTSDGDADQGVEDDRAFGVSSAASGGAKDTSGAAGTIRALLQPMRMEEYVAKMLDLGYDDPTDLYQMDDMELREERRVSNQQPNPVLIPASVLRGAGGHDRRHEARAPGSLRQESGRALQGENAR